MVILAPLLSNILTQTQLPSWTCQVGYQPRISWGNKVTLSTGPQLTFFGHPPPRDHKRIGDYFDLSKATISNPSIGDTPENVILSNGRVNKLMKILEVRGFAFETGTITIHVRFQTDT